MSADESTMQPWPGAVPAVMFRVVRPTVNYAEMVNFYSEGIGLKIINTFEDHYGYSGTMIGLPGQPYHLEIIKTASGDPNPCPNKDNNLVFYFEDITPIKPIEERLNGMGYPTVQAKNPWWNIYKAVTIEDPDGWPVIFYPLETPTD